MFILPLSLPPPLFLSLPIAIEKRRGFEFETGNRNGSFFCCVLLRATPRNLPVVALYGKHDTWTPAFLTLRSVEFSSVSVGLNYSVGVSHVAERNPEILNRFEAVPLN